MQFDFTFQESSVTAIQQLTNSASLSFFLNWHFELSCFVNDFFLLKWNKGSKWILILYTLEDHHFKNLASLNRNILIRHYPIHNHNVLGKRPFHGR